MIDMTGIVGIGVDFVEIDRFEDLSEHFLEKVFTRSEIEYCRSKKMQSQHFAGRFAAKEAIIKAMHGVGHGIEMNSIEILSSASGVPDARILVDELADYEILLSISHSRSIATAFTIVTKK